MSGRNVKISISNELCRGRLSGCLSGGGGLIVVQLANGFEFAGFHRQDTSAVRKQLHRALRPSKNPIMICQQAASRDVGDVHRT